VDPARFPPGVPPTHRAPAASFTVGFVGTLKQWHGLEVLVDAFTGLHLSVPSARLLIVGDGPERENLVDRLTRAGIRHAAHLTGAVAPEEVPGLLASMDVAVAPYPEETTFYFSPLKVYEYMVAGLPVVASRIGQLARLIEHERTGLLCEPGDAAALSAALQRLCEDRVLGERLGRHARELVQRHHTWDRVVQRIVELAGLPAAEPSMQAAANG
jgi:glycosyltransferase involved in cell wall biosynthesis